MTNSPETLVTKEGLTKLENELRELTEVKRPEISARIKEARELGDLKENAEYHDAKNEQGLVESKIRQLEEKIRTARIVEASDTSSVGFGNAVTVEDVSNGTKETWHITGAAEADPLEWRISNESPIGKALMGTKVGDEITVQLPTRTQSLRLVSIEKS